MHTHRSYYYWQATTDADADTDADAGTRNQPEPTDDDFGLEVKKVIKVEIKEGRSNFSIELEKDEAERLARDLLLQLGKTSSLDILADIVHEKKTNGEEW